MTDQTGIEDVETQCIASLHLSQSTPNPFDGTTFVNLNVTEPGDVSLVITDITGRIVGANNYEPAEKPLLFRSAFHRSKISDAKLSRITPYFADIIVRVHQR